MTRSVWRLSRARLVWVQEHADPACLAMLRAHRCECVNLCQGLALVAPIARAWGCDARVVFDALGFLARHYGACPGCVLVQFFDRRNGGPPTWFRRMFGQFFDFERGDTLSPHLAWSACRAAGSTSIQSALRLLSRTTSTVVQA